MSPPSVSPLISPPIVSPLMSPPSVSPSSVSPLVSLPSCLHPRVSTLVSPLLCLTPYALSSLVLRSLLQRMKPYTLITSTLGLSEVEITQVRVSQSQRRRPEALYAAGLKGAVWIRDEHTISHIS
ncbi:uncharacterized [Tachysurus ichikawai]